MSLLGKYACHGTGQREHASILGSGKEVIVVGRGGVMMWRMDGVGGRTKQTEDFGYYHLLGLVVEEE